MYNKNCYSCSSFPCGGTGNDCWWIIILVIIIWFVCCNNGSSGCIGMGGGNGHCCD